MKRHRDSKLKKGMIKRGGGEGGRGGGGRGRGRGGGREGEEEGEREGEERRRVTEVEGEGEFECSRE
jgi:hypothetical protein